MTKDRPTGISILAVLYLIGGASVLAAQIFLSGLITKGASAIGVSNVHAMLGFAFLGTIGVVSAIGMWTGKKWGWWLGAFYLFYSVARNAEAFLMIPTLLESLGMPEGGVTKHYVKHGGRVIIHSLLILYFFKSSVVDYFGVGAMGPWRRFSILLAATIAVALSFGVLAYLTSSLANSRH